MGNSETAGGPGRLWRSRWAAIGAAVAVTFGGGGLFAVQAASSVPSSVVTIDPVRILDTRTDVGLPGPFVSGVSQKLQVTGAAVPAGATGVLLNVTVDGPTAAGYVSVRPGDATGAPSTSSMNFPARDLIANAVQVGLPTAGANAGQVDITYDAYGVAGPTTEVLVDVVGYMVAGGAGTGPVGPVGPAGAVGPVGPAGPVGVSGWIRVQANAPTTMSNTKVLVATCPAGTRVMGGGSRIFSGEGLVGIDESYPTSDTTWYVEARTINNAVVNFGLFAFAICARVDG